jgi:hypothetical protein
LFVLGAVSKLVATGGTYPYVSGMVHSPEWKLVD